MANKSIFAGLTGNRLPKTDTVNRSGVDAFAYEPAHALAQIAMTGTFNDGFYGNGEMQLADLLTACEGVDPLTIAQTAIYARNFGHMKDVPALLLAVLSGLDTALFSRAFGRVITNGKMLRTFVQILSLIHI